MPEDKPNPIRETNAEARQLARTLIEDAAFGALGVRDPESGAPMVTRIAVARDDRGMPMTLISELSNHTKALEADPLCSLLLGEPGPKGDPLTHPRITLQASARFVDRADPAHGMLRGLYLAQHPKAKLYIDFADFRFARFQVSEAHLNGGFGKAFHLTPDDLRP